MVRYRAEFTLSLKKWAQQSDPGNPQAFAALKLVRQAENKFREDEGKKQGLLQSKVRLLPSHDLRWKR